MKKIFFSLSFLLGLCLSTYSHAAKTVAVDKSETIRHKHLLVANPTHDEMLYSIAGLIEEDNDDIGVGKEGFFPKVIKNTITYLSATAGTEEHAKSNTFFNELLRPTQPGFIYLRVLRI